MLSMWRDTAAMPEYGRLEGDVRTDVLVIGGGMAGILCAHFLRQAGVDCVLAEADRLCAGTTGNTTAKITSQHGLVYDRLLRRFGAEKAGMYLHANEAALARYRGMCREIDRFANLGFISIHGRRIDVSVAVPDGPADRVDDFFTVRGVTPKAISRHDRAVIQRHGLRYVANAHGCSP